MTAARAAHRRPRRRLGRGPATIGLSLTAMIDVVFLLLVYFIASTEFRLGEEIYRLDLPQRGRPADPYELPREPIRLSVASIGDGPNAYVIRLEPAGHQPTDFQELYEHLARNRRDETGLGGLFEPDHPILIEPAGNTRWEHTMGAFNAAARARYTNITFVEPR